jgi:hypothetical protein
MCVCHKCGTLAAADLERCLRDQKQQCQFERLSTQRESHPVVGFVCLFLSITTALGCSTVLFVTPGGEGGLMPILQALLLIAIYTFVYSIAGIFFVVGLLFLFYRQQDLRDKGGSRFVQIATLLRRTLSFQVVDVEAPAAFAGYPLPPAIPASVAALHQVVTAVQSHTPGSIVERLKHLNDVSDGLTQKCLISAMVNLMVRGAIRIRPAHGKVVWPCMSESPTFTINTHLLEVVPEQPPSGALESLLAERIRDWPTGQQGDYPLATMAELVDTFKDCDGDFSQHQILKVVEEEAVINNWFNRRPQFSFKKVLPEPNPAAAASIQRAVDTWMWILDAFRRRHPDLLFHMERDLAAVVKSDKGGQSDLVIAQRRLCKTMILRLIGLATFMAAIVYFISRIAQAV